MYSVIYHDHFDHEQHLGEFDSLSEARELFNNLLKMPIEPYDYGYELVDSNYECLDWIVVQPEPGD